MRTKSESVLRYYLEVIARRRWLVLVGFILPIAAAVLLTVRATKLYQGSASVVISRQSLADEVTDSPDPVASASDFLSIVQTYADSARSTQVADQAVGSVPEAHLTASQLLSHSLVTPSQDSDILGFSVTNASGRLAERLATAYATAFVNYQQQQSTAAIRLALRQLSRAKLRGQATNQELRTLEALQTGNNFVFTSSTSASISSPKKTTNLALGIVGGLVLAALLAGLVETLDTRVRSTEEVEAILGIPLLGRIGPAPAGQGDRVLSLAQPASSHTEGFRVLRTNLELQAMRNDAKVFMVTSSIELEGKSVTLANLAVLAARAGRRTVLVDLDLRRPTQDILFGSPERAPGVTNVLLGRVSVDEALVDIPLPEEANDPGRGGSLHLLRAGILPPDPGELVASHQLDALIQTLRDRAELILIDSPPVLRAGDAMALSRLCDAVFVVARIANVKRPMLAELARTIASCPVPVLGFVATGTQTKALAYGYYGEMPERAKPAAATE